MHAVRTIAAKDLRQRLRDRSAWILVFLAPLAITALMALSFGSSAEFHADLGYVDQDRGPAAAGLRQTLESPELARRLPRRRLPRHTGRSRRSGWTWVARIRSAGRDQVPRGAGAGRPLRGPLGPSCHGRRTMTLELWPHARP
ncbi:hypothetical protein [Streptomyces sp.]|uniref:hypothetical protein n=1 Tax=Streptomyces sp. TaxID=1931 RepID=UPI002D797FB2|nr:hypothetical protein [Streptomyces sp.]HET6352681.1 hypothetical protein [Streptomyces sp.]